MKTLQPYCKESIEELYLKDGLSWIEIAKLYNTYPNCVRRQAIQWGIKSRTKSEAQSQALSSGRLEHPTKGKVRPEEVKYKISEKMATIWENLTDEEYNKRVDQAKDQWNNMGEAEKEAFQKASAIAIRQAAKNGSKLEQHLYKTLQQQGYYIEYHKEHLIMNERLHLDLFIPKINTAVEVDGPSHFLPIWGVEHLQKNKQSDAQKSGLVLAKEMVLIRIKHPKTLSNKYKRDVVIKLVKHLKSIENKYPDKDSRFITIE